MAKVVPIIRDDESKLYIGEQFAPQPPSSKVSDQMIDLGEYGHPGDLKDRYGNTLAVFQYHKFLDLDTVDTESEIFDQVGTKQGDVEDAEIDDLVDNLRLDGFVKEDRLPQYDENEHPINGRMRTKAMSRKSVINPTVYGVDARWMPVSIFKWEEGVTYRQKAALYGRLSITRPHTLQTRKTFIKEGVALCAKGELDPSSENDVTNYVRYESAAGEKFTDMGGNLKKIIDGIQKLGQAVESGVANTKTLSRAGWVDKVTKDGYELESKRIVLTSVDEVTYAYRAFAEHILPAIREDKTPVKFILYTNKDDANEAKEAMNSFVTLIDKLWEDVFGGVNKVTKANFNPKDFDNPYIILGAVPQVIGRHTLDSAKLIPIDKY